jgi:hypothetical protein
VTGIRNVAAENSIRKAVDMTPGCACVSVQQQSDYYLVHLSEFGASRVIKVDNAAHALRILNRQEPQEA